MDITQEKSVIDWADLDTADLPLFICKDEVVRLDDIHLRSRSLGDERLETVQITTLQSFENALLLHESQQGRRVA